MPRQVEESASKNEWFFLLMSNLVGDLKITEKKIEFLFEIKKTDSVDSLIGIFLKQIQLVIELQEGGTSNSYFKLICSFDLKEFELQTK